MNTQRMNVNREQNLTIHNGWVMLPIVIGLLLGSIWVFVYSIAAGVKHGGEPIWPLFIGAILSEATSILMLVGFFTLQPNEARVLVLFGLYKGTVRESGFHWGNPFYSNGPRTGTFASRIAEAQNQAAASSRLVFAR